ncbi:MAG: hypothetical protein K6F17_02405 [Lachnospiraceae bacterium]|nr:hypothetical protein [Lachnospiraceae bacterium]
MSGVEHSSVYDLDLDEMDLRCKKYQVNQDRVVNVPLYLVAEYMGVM